MSTCVRTFCLWQPTRHRTLCPQRLDDPCRSLVLHTTGQSSTPRDFQSSNIKQTQGQCVSRASLNQHFELNQNKHEMLKKKKKKVSYSLKSLPHSLPNENSSWNCWETWPDLSPNKFCFLSTRTQDVTPCELQILPGVWGILGISTFSLGRPV